MLLAHYYFVVNFFHIFVSFDFTWTSCSDS